MPSSTAIWCDWPRKHLRFPAITMRVKTTLNPRSRAQSEIGTPLSLKRARTCSEVRSGAPSTAINTEETEALIDSSFFWRTGYGIENATKHVAHCC